MKLLHTLGHVPILGGGFRWMESEMQNNLVKHSVFAALAYLLVSQTNFMMSLDRYLSVPKYLVSLFHAVVFGIIMYVSSMFLFTPFLVEGLDGDEEEETTEGSEGEGTEQTGPEQMGSEQTGPEQMAPEQMAPEQTGPGQMGPEQTEQEQNQPETAPVNRSRQESMYGTDPPAPLSAPLSGSGINGPLKDEELLNQFGSVCQKLDGQN